MNTTTQNNDTETRGGRIITIVLLVVFLGLMIATYYVVGIQNEHDQRYIGIFGEQQVLSQQIAKNAAEAADGLPDAFSLLKKARDQYDKNLKILRNGDKTTGLPSLVAELSPKLKSLEDLWKSTDGDTIAILNVMKPITSLYEYVRQFGVYAVDTVLQTDELVNVMLETGAHGEQVYLATRELMLMERINNNIQDTLKGGEGAITAADHFGRDAILFEQVINGLIDGSKELGIEKINDPEAREILQNIAARVQQQSGLITNILESSIELFRIQEAASTIFENSDGLLERAGLLKESYEKYSENRLISGQIANIFGGAAVLMLFLLGWQISREQKMAAQVARLRAEEAAQNEEEARIREQQTLEANRQNQEAILRLLGEISDLADGDLTVTATVTEDFTGAIADAINYSIEEMRGLVGQIISTSAQVAVSAKSSSELADGVDRLSEKQATEIELASNTVTRMTSTLNSMSATASNSSDVAQKSVTIAGKGRDAVNNTINGMNTLRENIQETSKRIKRLGESSQEIGDIVGLIDDIADQTNILALNAAIQASMAGESGRGFAVVADEVQRLAERSGQATRQIESLVKTIQADTNDAVISMEKSTTEVVEGAKLAESAGDALTEIESVSSQLAALVQEISVSSEKQASEAGIVSETMSTVRHNSLKTAEDTRETSKTIGKLTELAEELQKSVSGFTLP